MELRQLGHFIAVAEEAHFTRAAARVHLAQSSLSASIAALERELGVALLARNSRRVELTEAGRALLPAARRALDAASDAHHAVDAVRGLLRGQLRIGLIQTFGHVDLPQLLARYHRRYPAVTLRLRHDSVPTLIDATIDGELDLAFVDHPLNSRRVVDRPLGVESLVLAVARQDPLANQSSVALADLHEYGFVEYRADSALRAQIDSAYAQNGLERRMIAHTDTIPSLIDLVAHGIGVALVPPLAASGIHNVTSLRTVPAIRRSLSIVTAADRPPTPAAAALLNLLTPDPVDR